MHMIVFHFLFGVNCLKVTMLSGKPFNKLQICLVTKLVSLIVINKLDANHKKKSQMSKMSDKNMIV